MIAKPLAGDSGARVAARFRAALLLYLALIALVVIVMVLEIGYDDALSAYVASNAESFPLDGGSGIALDLAMVVLLVAFVAGFVGLFLFKPWGRTFSLWPTLAVLPMYLVFGPSAASALESMLYDASNMLWGAILAAAYWSPAAALFQGARSAPADASASEEHGSLSP